MIADWPIRLISQCGCCTSALTADPSDYYALVFQLAVVQYLGNVSNSLCSLGYPTCCLYS